MSINNGEGTVSKKTAAIKRALTVGTDSRTTVEAHIRVASTKSTGRWGLGRSEISDIAKKIHWAPTAHRPNGQTWWGYQTSIDENGHTPIGDAAAVEYFDKNEGHLMIKVVSQMKDQSPYFAAPTRRGEAYKNVYALDETDPIRNPDADNPSYVYSVPLHNMSVGKTRWFYIVRLANDPKNQANIRIWVDKVHVVRGKDYFRVNVKECYSNHGLERLLLPMVQRDENLCDLGIAEILDLYHSTISDGVSTIIRTA